MKSRRFLHYLTTDNSRGGNRAARRFVSVSAALAMTAALAGCSASGSRNVSETTGQTEAESVSEASSEQSQETEVSQSRDLIRVGSLKGPTSMGLVHMMNDESLSETYDFTMAAAADELLASMVSGELDIALLPANAASVLYNKTEGKIQVIDINTLGVLYLVSGDPSITSWADLAGKTVYLTGKGTTPDYVLQYLLREQAAANGFDAGDVKLEYKSEATEIASLLSENPDAVGLLPQPFATVSMSQNEALRLVFDMTSEWDKVQGEGGSRLVTGVTVVSDSLIETNPEAVAEFLDAHEESAALALSEPDETAALVVKEGIIEKEPVAKKALPYCSIVYIEGEEMKSALSGYLEVLFEQDPKSVGGALPGDDFYYLAQ